jgi:ABC-type branched-subunit amino acid transport system substrate-binding protein
VARHYEAYRSKYKDAKDDLYWTTQIQALEMLAKAMQLAKSTDPVKVARALEGLKLEGDTGEAATPPRERRGVVVSSPPLRGGVAREA